MATVTEHRLAAARVALQRAQAAGADAPVIERLERAYIAAVLDAQDACGAA